MTDSRHRIVYFGILETNKQRTGEEETTANL